MDDALKAELTTWLKDLRSVGGNARDFAIEQAPLVAKEIIAYGWTWYVITLVIACVVLLISIVAGAFAIRFIIKSDEEETVLLAVPHALGIALSISLMMSSIFGLMEIATAPRLYLIEQLSSMLK